MQLPYTLKPWTTNDSTNRKINSVASSVSTHSRQSGLAWTRAAGRAGNRVRESAGASPGGGSGRAGNSGSGETCSMRIRRFSLPARCQQDVDESRRDRLDLKSPTQQRPELRPREPVVVDHPRVVTVFVAPEPRQRRVPVR